MLTRAPLSWRPAAVFDANVTAPPAANFAVSLAQNVTGGEVSAVVPYVPDTMYLLQASPTPCFATAQHEPC